jgi:Domain of unknown function (DUF6484)
MKNRSVTVPHEELESAMRAAEVERQYGVVVAKLDGFDAVGQPMIRDEANVERCARTARSMVPLRSTDIGQELVVAFERGDIRSPIIMGKLAPALGEATSIPRRLELEATEGLVLRCGAASITLTREGKVMIRGTYLLSRSSGLHRILGAVLRLN